MESRTRRRNRGPSRPIGDGTTSVTWSQIRPATRTIEQPFEWCLRKRIDFDSRRRRSSARRRTSVVRFCRSTRWPLTSPGYVRHLFARPSRLREPTEFVGGVGSDIGHKRRVTEIASMLVDRQRMPAMQDEGRRTHVVMQREPLWTPGIASASHPTAPTVSHTPR